MMPCLTVLHLSRPLLHIAMQLTAILASRAQQTPTSVYLIFLEQHYIQIPRGLHAYDIWHTTYESTQTSDPTNREHHYTDPQTRGSSRCAQHVTSKPLLITLQYYTALIRSLRPGPPEPVQGVISIRHFLHSLSFLYLLDLTKGPQLYPSNHPTSLPVGNAKSYR